MLRIEIGAKPEKLCKAEIFRFFAVFQLFSFLHFSVKSCLEFLSKSYPRNSLLILGYRLVS